MISLKNAALAAALAVMLTGGAARADSDDHRSSMMEHGDHHGMPYEHVEGHIAFLNPSSPRGPTNVFSVI